MKRSIRGRFFLVIAVFVCALFAGGAVKIVQDQCGPFTDVTPAFCPFVSELYYLGITAGTSATTFSPDDPLTRGQAAVFIAKGLNQSLARSSRRAALGQWWTTTPHYDLGLGLTGVGLTPGLVQSDGADLWVANQGDGTVSRVRASDGRVLESWTGADGAFAVLAAMGRVFVTGQRIPGVLYMLDPSQPAGAVTIVTNSLGAGSLGIAFDGSRIWTANSSNGSSGGSVSIVTPTQSFPWSVTTVTADFSAPGGIVFDGSSMWVTDAFEGTLKRLDSGGAVQQTIPVGSSNNYPGFPAFDGANLWVPSSSGVTVVRVSTGTVLASLSGNGLTNPVSAAFDGKNVLVTNYSGTSVSLFKAADLSASGSVSTSGVSNPLGACSDGLNFWITFQGSSKLGRF